MQPKRNVASKSSYYELNQKMPITLKSKGANSKMGKIPHQWQFCLYLEDALNVNILVLYLFSLVETSVPLLQFLLAKMLCPKRNLKFLDFLTIKSKLNIEAVYLQNFWEICLLRKHVLLNFILLCCLIWCIYSPCISQLYLFQYM